MCNRLARRSLYLFAFTRDESTADQQSVSKEFHCSTYASKVRRPVSKADFNSFSMIVFMYVLVLLQVQTRFTMA